MERINFNEVDTDDEKVKVFNRIIDNQNQIEGKLLQTLGIYIGKVVAIREDDNIYVGAVTKINQDNTFDVDFPDGCDGCYRTEDLACNIKQKGFTTVKTLLMVVLMVCMFVASVHGAYRTTDINYDIASNPETLARYLRDSFANLDGTSVVFTPTDTVPIATEGTVYYNATAIGLRLRTDDAWVDIDVAGSSSLDAAYTIGQGITVDSGAMTLTAGSSDDNVAMALVQADTDAGVAALTVTSAGNAAAILIAQSGSGTDIEFTDGGSISKVSAVVIEGGITDLTDGSAILMDTDNEIAFGDNAQEVSMGFGTGTTLTWSSDSGITTVEWGAVDSHTGLDDLTFDAAGSNNTITCAGSTTAKDLTIQQTGAGNASLILQSSGTGTDALSLISSVADISLVSFDNITRTAADDITDVTTDGAYTVTVGGATDGIYTVTAASTGSIIIADTFLIQNSEAGKDLTVDSALGSVIIDGGEAIADAVTITASTALGGIDITSNADIDITTTGASDEDISLINTGGSVELSASEDATDAINIDATAGGIDIDAVGESGQDIVITNTGGSILITATESAVDSIRLQSTLGGIDIQCDAATSEDIDILNTGGSINLVATENANDSIVIQSTLGGIDITCSASDDAAIDITNAAGPIVISSTHDQDPSITVTTSDAAGQILIDSGDETADGINIDAAGGIDIDAVLEAITIDTAAASKDIALTSALGSVVITGTKSAAKAVEIVADGTAGGVSIDAKTNGIILTAASGDITLNLSGAVGDVVTVTNTTGTGAGAIELTATAGSIDLNANAAHDITVTGGQVTIASGHNTASAISLTANVGSTETIVITNTQGTAADAISLIATAGSVNIDAKETITIDLDTGTAATSLITITNADGDDEAAIGIISTSGGVDIDGAAGKNIALNAGQILIEAEDASAAAIQLLTNTGAGETILITNTAGTGAGAIALTATAGGITAKVADGKLLTLSDSDGASYFRVAPASSAASEILTILNAKGTAAGSIVVTSSAGGMDINTAETFTVNVAGGTAGSANILLHNAIGTGVDSIELTTTTGGIEINAKSQIGVLLAAGAAGTSNIVVTNTPGTDENAIELTATAGGVTINAAAGKDFVVEAGQVLLTGNHDAADCVLLHAEAGSTQTITIVNDEGTAVADGAAAVQLLGTLGSVGLKSGLAHANSIWIQSTAGGVNIDAITAYDVAIAGGQVLIDSIDNTASAIALTTNVGSSETIVVTNTQGETAGAIALTATAGGIAINATAAAGKGILTLNSLIGLSPALTLADNATPDVSGGSFFETGAATTYTGFDVDTGTVVEGTIIIIKSLHAAVYDVTGQSIEGGTTDITTASGDVVMLIYDGASKWRVISYMDMAENLN